MCWRIRIRKRGPSSPLLHAFPPASIAAFLQHHFPSLALCLRRCTAPPRYALVANDRCPFYPSRSVLKPTVLFFPCFVDRVRCRPKCPIQSGRGSSTSRRRTATMMLRQSITSGWKRPSASLRRQRSVTKSQLRRCSSSSRIFGMSE